MNGPYTYTATFGATVKTGAHKVKRLAIRTMRFTTKQLGESAVGEVRDADGQLVRQVEAYTTQGGAVKVRDLEL